MRRNVLFITFVLFLSSLTLADDSAFSGEGKKLDNVTLRLNWLPYVDYAFYAVGVKKGFYRAEGIELSFGPAKGSSLSTKLVANRTDTFGTASADTVLMARLQGMSLKVLAVFHQKTPVSIFSLKSIALNSPKDLEGKTIASDPASMKHKQFEAFCALNDVDISTITIVPIKGSDFIHLLNGSVDAMLAFGYLGEAILAKEGQEFNEIKLSDYGIDLYGISLITHEKLIEENPDLVRRFVAATITSWEYAIGHPEEAINALIELYPELGNENLIAQFKGVASLLQTDETKAYGLGYQSEERWNKLEDFLYETKMIDTETDVTHVFTDDFLAPPLSQKE